MKDLGDEYHDICVCKNEIVIKFRETILPRYHWQYQSMFKFTCTQMLSSISENMK